MLAAVSSLLHTSKSKADLHSALGKEREEETESVGRIAPPNTPDAVQY
jgi:hypothetical protein